MKIVNRTTYEWDHESIDEHGDIIDHNFCESFPGIPTDPNIELVLVKDIADGIYGEEDSFELDHRTWAYVVNGKLPVEFDDGSKVPQRFHKEFN